MDRIFSIIKKFIPKKLFKKLQPGYHFVMSWFSAFIFGNPSEKLIVIGITGTAGKTTSVYLIAKMLEEAGYKTGYTSTAMFNDGSKEWLNDKKMTMVGRFFTQNILKQMCKNGCKYAIIETTSEGIRQFRHRFINYDIVIFTGLYPEHIESHGGFENYKKAKGELFNHLKRCRKKFVDDKKIVQKQNSGIKTIGLNRIKKTIIANFDNEHAEYYLSFWAEEKIAYAENDEVVFENIDNLNLINYQNIEVDSFGTHFKVDDRVIDVKLLGEFNVANVMNAYCVGVSQGLSHDVIQAGLGKIEGVPGRFERIDEGQDYIVIVDYAYEPKAVTKLYETLALLTHNSIIHVLGSCGGGRDEARRPVLGKLAGQKADYIIVTNEDPYDDDPQLIIDQVALGVEHVGKKLEKNLFKILDRRQAIEKAISLASAGDIVLITGKGSEQAICVENGKKIKWDDREVVREVIKKQKNS